MNGDVASGRLVLEGVEHREARAIGKADVEDDGARPIVRRHRQPLFAVRRDDRLKVELAGELLDDPREVGSSSMIKMTRSPGGRSGSSSGSARRPAGGAAGRRRGGRRLEPPRTAPEPFRQDEREGASVAKRALEGQLSTEKTRQIARDRSPRPVPPYLRLVVPSA